MEETEMDKLLTEMVKSIVDKPEDVQVVVNESQDAIFVKSGEVLDVLGPGTHTLTTGNIPILEKLINFPFGGNTPFSAEVWYVNKTVKRNFEINYSFHQTKLF